MHSRLRPPLRFPCLAIESLILGLILMPAAPAAEHAQVEALKNEADRWIELEVRAAQERAGWQSEKEVLAASIEVLKREREQLQAKVESNAVAAGVFQARVDQARREFDAHETLHANLAQSCAAYAERLRALSVRLPQPLQERIQPQLDRLATAAEAPESVGVAERVQLVVSALTAIDQFNNSLTLTNQLRENGNGETVNVKVLYWGLAAGFGIDAQGRYAWALRPGPDGWEWHDASEHREAIATLIRVRERETPEFVILPINPTGGAQ